MNLLVITNNPRRPSFRQRIAIYLDILSKKGIECEVLKLPHGTFKRLKAFKEKASKADVVFVQKKCLTIFEANGLRKYSKKIIYDFDDAMMYSPKTPENNRTSHFGLFRRASKLADMIIAGNAYLAEHAQRFNSNVKVLPTGLNTKDYNIKTKPEDDGKIRIVWIGSKSTLPYLEMLKPALEEIGKRYDNVVLRIICDRFFDLENMEVEKCQWSLQSQYFDLIAGDIGLAPLPDNRFTRGKCGFKILQYEAAALPVITSPVGVNSEYTINGVTGYLATETQEWIRCISNLIENSDLRKKMGAAGRREVEHLDSSIVAQQLFTLITECFEGQKNKCIESLRIKRHIQQINPTNPKVSICIPTYNRKEYLKETLDSILSQTYKDYEIVIVDDGSTDGTEEMLKELGIPITYYWQKNNGDASARNKLIELAKGDYISFIDSDDLLMPDTIERLVKAIEIEDEEVIVYGSYFRIDEQSMVFGKCKRKLYSGNITTELFRTILVHSCGSMFPKKILANSPHFDTSLKVCSDYDLWLRLSLKHRFIAIPEPTFKRRRHASNLSGATFENCLTEFKVLERFYHEKGGDAVVPEKIARKVFSKETRRTGYCALKEGLYKQACQFFSQSFQQHPNFKSLTLWIRAKLAQ
ncbi:MAG: glycosyltransferase [Planctomycetes bacterium]|nr:glycosyltransferase [Planctomycetota bacterium]